MKSNQALKVLCIGECMVEFSKAKADALTPQSDLFARNFAGDSYNTAVYLARQFSPQLNIAYCTGLGRDALSKEMLAHFQAEGLETEPVRYIADRQPGLYLIENDATGERFFQYWRNQSAAKRMFAQDNIDDLVQELGDYDAIYLTGISLAILDEEQRKTLFAALLKIKATASAFIAFDPNFRPALWPDLDQARVILQKMAALADLALVTLDDDHALWSEGSTIDFATERWMEFGATEVVIKEGASNCTIALDNKLITVKPQKALKPVDTTGAGDAFAAGYLGARLQGQSPEKAAELAHQIAGQVIMHPGGVISKCNWQKVCED